MSAQIKIDGQDIVVPSPWSQVDFIDNINAKIHCYHNNPIRSAYLRVLNCSHPGIINEALDAIIEMSHTELGLQSLSL